MRRRQSTPRRWDWVALVTAFKAVTLEGIEVIIIVIGLGAVQGLLLEASMGALAACVLVAVAALILQRPLARLPENSLKLVVGIVMSAFGLFWFGEGIGLQWPYDDGAVLGLVAILTGATWVGIRVAARLQWQPWRTPRCVERSCERHPARVAGAHRPVRR